MEVALVIKGLLAINETVAQVRAIMAARAAGKISEELAGAELDKIIAQSHAFEWEPATPAEVSPTEG